MLVEDDLPGKPNSDLNWLEAIVIAAADVNPAVTGIEMNSTKNPENIEQL